MSNDLFQKVVDTVQVSGGEGGILSPDQSNRFIDYMWDATSLGRTVRKVRMTAPVREIDKMDLGQRIARHATEGIDDARNQGPTFSKIQLTTEKIRLDWELTSESLEDNIEQGGLEDHIARLMATQLGNDLEDLAINGDVDDDGDDAALMSAFDGYYQRAQDGATRLDAGGEGISTGLFNRAYKALPRKYKARRGELRFFIGSGILQDYHQHLVQLGLNAGTNVQGIGTNAPGQSPQGAGGETGLAAFGIPLFEVPLFLEEYPYEAAGDVHGYFVLTHPDNHIWGVKRDITVHRQFAPKKDAIEYTVFTRQGVQIDNLEAYVVVENIANEDYTAVE